MEIIAEIIFSFIGEVFIQIIFELFAECGISAFSKDTNPKHRPFFAAIGYFILGAIAGGISLLILKNQFIADPTLQIANLIAMPLVAGFIMMQIRQRKLRSGKIVVRLDSFTYGAVFAFGMALVRYIWAA